MMIDIDIDIIYTFICSHAVQRNGLERGFETFAKLMAIQVSKLIPRWETTTRSADVSRFKAKTVGRRDGRTWGIWVWLQFMAILMRKIMINSEFFFFLRVSSLELI